MAQSLNFERGQGGVPKSLPGEDHISGFIMCADDIPGKLENQGVLAISTIQKAESYGITQDAKEWSVRVLHYHISEALKANPAISLYVLVASTIHSGLISVMQNHAGGRIRQFMFFAPDYPITDPELIGALKVEAGKLRQNAVPAHILHATSVDAISNLPKPAQPGFYDVSAVIAQDGAGVALELFQDPLANNRSVTTAGLALGTLSAARVHESISWVQKFNTGISEPAFADGTLVRDVDGAILEQLDADRYIFLTTYPGIGGSYFQDSHTLDEPTSDYAYIEANRTMDKAERGIRTYLTPYLGAPLYVDAESGKLRPDTVAFLETLAGRQLEDMEAAGELSGYRVEVDPEQNVLATSTVEFVIKQVQVGVMRRMNVKIGYTTKLE